MTFLHIEEYTKALEQYRVASKYNPLDAKINSNSATCHMKLGEYEKAVEEADECIRKDPKFGTVDVPFFFFPFAYIILNFKTYAVCLIIQFIYAFETIRLNRYPCC